MTMPPLVQLCPSPKIHTWLQKSLKGYFFIHLSRSNWHFAWRRGGFLRESVQSKFSLWGIFNPPPLCLGNSPTIAFYYFKEWHIKMPQFNVCLAHKASDQTAKWIGPSSRTTTVLKKKIDFLFFVKYILFKFVPLLITYI